MAAGAGPGRVAGLQLPGVLPGRQAAAAGSRRAQALRRGLARDPGPERGDALPRRAPRALPGVHDAGVRRPVRDVPGLRVPRGHHGRGRPALRGDVLPRLPALRVRGEPRGPHGAVLPLGRRGDGRRGRRGRHVPGGGREEAGGRPEEGEGEAGGAVHQGADGRVPRRRHQRPPLAPPEGAAGVERGPVRAAAGPHLRAEARPACRRAPAPSGGPRRFHAAHQRRLRRPRARLEARPGPGEQVLLHQASLEQVLQPERAEDLCLRPLEGLRPRRRRRRPPGGDRAVALRRLRQPAGVVKEDVWELRCDLGHPGGRRGPRPVPDQGDVDVRQEDAPAGLRHAAPRAWLAPAEQAGHPGRPCAAEGPGLLQLRLPLDHGPGVAGRLGGAALAQCGARQGGLGPTLRGDDEGLPGATESLAQVSGHGRLQLRQLR
mmetsp:Transcript_20685/g.54254  ORF Transcript_20685/g.54254 Transcript_20685/m.54254 type:complete len:432 (-) Transcript_20685:984-2279(-)